MTPGDFVEAPLGGRALAGVVWGIASNRVHEAKLKPLARRCRRRRFPMFPADLSIGLRIILCIRRVRCCEC